MRKTLRRLLIVYTVLALLLSTAVFGAETPADAPAEAALAADQTQAEPAAAADQALAEPTAADQTQAEAAAAEDQAQSEPVFSPANTGLISFMDSIAAKNTPSREGLVGPFTGNGQQNKPEDQKEPEGDLNKPDDQKEPEADKGQYENPKPDEEPLFQWEGFYVYPLYYKIHKSGDTSPTLTFYVQAINNTDRNLSLVLGDTEIDGTSVLGTGIFGVEPHSDSGDEGDEFFMIIVDSTIREAGDDAVMNGRTLVTDVSLKDNAADEELYAGTLTIDLNKIEREEFIWEPETTTEAYEPETTKAEPKVYYRSLMEGDSGDDVRRLQEKLIELGYLNDVADGSYGPKTARAVRDFNESNGLGSYSVAYIDTQELLFSGLANPYTDPWIPLEIGDYFQWDPVYNANTCFFRIQVTNRSRYRTVKGYEIKLYTTNIWGDRVEGDLVYYYTVSGPVGPGETIYSDYFSVGYFASVDTVWVGISKIVFSDGEVRETNVVEYYPCEIPK